MNKKWLGCVLVALAVAGVSWSQGGTAKAVEALEQQWLQSQKTNNPDLVAPLLAEKFVGTGADGKASLQGRGPGGSEGDQIHQH